MYSKIQFCNLFRDTPQTIEVKEVLLNFMNNASPCIYNLRKLDF